MLASHRWLAATIQPGERCIDATCGRGRDLLLLRQLVGGAGEVVGIDLQPEALRSTREHQRAASGTLGSYRLVCGDHARLADFVPSAWCGTTAAVVLNLGYLPSGDRSVVTRTPSTLAALASAYALLRTGGLLAVVAYSGHAAGVEEARAVEAWMRAAAGDPAELLVFGDEPRPGGGPIAYGLHRPSTQA